MKSRLITALAIGALAAGMLPGVVAAAEPGFDCYNGTDHDLVSGCVTPVDVYVTSGTSFTVPAAIHINISGDLDAFPGQTIDNKGVDADHESTVTWWSNEAPKNVTATMGDLQGVADDQYIANDDVSLVRVDEDNLTVSTADFGEAVMVGDIADVSGGTLESASHQDFYLKLFVPQATEDQYKADLIWTIE